MGPLALTRTRTIGDVWKISPVQINGKATNHFLNLPSTIVSRADLVASMELKPETSCEAGANCCVSVAGVRTVLPNSSVVN